MVLSQLARCLRVTIPAAAIAIVLAGSAWSTPAHAGVTVELSPEATDAYNAKGGSARATTRQLQRDFNRGLEELGKTNPDAKALFDSGQKLRIVCFGTKEAEDAKLKPGTGMYGGGGETKGDFDANGKPKAGGTAIIAIDCGTVREIGMQRLTVPSDPNSTMYRILIHELLHASNAARRHPPDDTAIYDQFVQDFEAALARAIARPPRERDQRSSSVSPRARSSGGSSASQGAAFAGQPASPAGPGGARTPFTWTGAYIGMNVGLTSGRNEFVDPKGGSIGAHVGYGLMAGSVYLGLEGSFRFLGNVAGSKSEFGVTEQQTLNGTGSILARFGCCDYGNRGGTTPLVYLTAGRTWTRSEYSIHGMGFRDTDTRVLSGWTGGIGIEVPVAENVSVDVQYLSTWYQAQTFFDGTLEPGPTRTDYIGFRVNYRPPI